MTMIVALAIAGAASARVLFGANGASPAHASEVCIASQYGVGDGYHGRRTASGRIFDTYASDPYTIARPSRNDLGRRFRITNLKTGASIEAVSTDLGPFIAGRCVDLGRAGADALGIGGLGFVRVERLD
ncbi:septal ring lytic transglycosylase RlpA family protein [Bradyrhizobium sp. DOA9]|uniref:septal ring lytic transglycosylase RlpA family protein n=1 Tax=Bradyrhizobium sp. DOA9 TaxID=1126627 RepID=UPI000468EA49|nr:septal ring lytic transglycosylase RlpA family protein [Bradyrhizobium sp. DOA9]